MNVHIDETKRVATTITAAVAAKATKAKMICIKMPAGMKLKDENSKDYFRNNSL